VLLWRYHGYGYGNLTESFIYSRAREITPVSLSPIDPNSFYAYEVTFIMDTKERKNIDYTFIGRSARWKVPVYQSSIRFPLNYGNDSYY
jgi:hypothetical protein